MFAIVTIAGQQFKVEEGQEIFVHRLEAKAGDSVSFDAVHLLANGDDVTVGTPMLSGASIGATVVDPLVKGDKVIIFKKKRRKGYRLKKGHRQQFTKLKIDSIAG
ncbi:large subunit ribosomal protein L21 [Neolewinella xylanilytica]|uniref:Large ribosomal subunit protein bL21 n=1 Tax=Neolewinella xylanilytica TaxID=1514080 RepID=A0A2S6HZU2_9BACT|nr:50S ribosomal protein L21 [Neolewinella xylanilytica]PPK84043.1 large subunit ribosomal protein L21 [Neolewinella xylanilytica]